MSTATSAWAHGLATVSTDSATEGSVLDVWFPHPHLGERPEGDEAPREWSRQPAATTPGASAARS